MDKCFEDETGQAPDELSEEEFKALSDERKWLAFENVLEMFYGVHAELEEKEI